MMVFKGKLRTLLRYKNDFLQKLKQEVPVNDDFYGVSLPAFLLHQEVGASGHLVYILP